MSICQLYFFHFSLVSFQLLIRLYSWIKSFNMKLNMIVIPKENIHLNHFVPTYALGIALNQSLKLKCLNL
jgi:hypothetical protein